MPFGQLVVGPPGSGKSTYCAGLQQYLSGLGRKVGVVNLDPANDGLPYECAIDITDLVSLEEVMRETKLGPNGGEGQARGFARFRYSIAGICYSSDTDFQYYRASLLHGLSHREPGLAGGKADSPAKG